MENQKPEALELADIFENLAHPTGTRYRAAAELRRLHARVQELEKDLNGAKRLVSKIWNQHPEAREAIEEGTGVWMVFGQDVETSVSAQRITQAAQAREAAEKSATHGMSLHQRILHVGGRENAQTYIEFGSVAAVRALVAQVLRDWSDSAHGFAVPAPQPQADGRDAAWSDLKIAFDIPDGEDETLWKCVESGAITLPNGWKLIETTGAGGVGPVAVFRTEHLPTSSETFVVVSAINYAIAASKEKAK